MDQPFAMRASVGTFHFMSACPSAGALLSAFCTVGSSLAKSKFWPASMPMRFIRARIGWSVMCGCCCFSNSAAMAKYLSAGIVST